MTAGRAPLWPAAAALVAPLLAVAALPVRARVVASAVDAPEEGTGA